MTKIIADLEGSESIELKKRRELVSFSVDAQKQEIKVYYRDVSFYEKDEQESEVSKGEIKHYKADYQEWFDSEAGKAIKAAIIERMKKEGVEEIEGDIEE